MQTPPSVCQAGAVNGYLGGDIPLGVIGLNFNGRMTYCFIILSRA